MINSFLNIIDRLIQLFTIRKTNKRKLFIDHIEPLYSEMSEIHKDYLNACRELKSYVSNKSNTDYSLNDIKETLTKYKTTLEPERVKVFTLAQFVKNKKLRKQLFKEALPFYDSCFLYFCFAAGEPNFLSEEMKDAFMPYSGLYTKLYKFTDEYMSGEQVVNLVSFNKLLNDQEQFLSKSWDEISKIYSELRLSLLK